VYGRKQRKKNVEQVISEIKSIQNQLGRIRIGFGDDNLLTNKEYSKKLLQKLIKLNVRWAAQTDISIAEDDVLLQLLEKSGCTFLFIGFESLSENSLKSIDKHAFWKLKRLKNYRAYIKKIQSYGIGIMGSFIIGLENDDSTVFQKIENFIIDNNLYDAQSAILTPFPGTTVWKRMKACNQLLSTSWENYTGFDVNFRHKVLAQEELENGLLNIYLNINTLQYYRKKMQYFKEIKKRIIVDWDNKTV
jgi:radical SAM superfamily enzyme YgiQ (UPF0313 family)